MSWSVVWSPSLSCLALATVAVLAYCIGRRRSWGDRRRQDTRHDMQRALAVIHDLEVTSRRLLSALAGFGPSISRFERNVDRLERGAGATWQEFYDRADELLRPTSRLATEISHAYAEVLRQMTQLSSLAELRSDPLTKVNNRRAFDDSLAALLREQARHPAPFSLLILDIDHFKRINDQSGHLAGDKVLQDLAQLVKSNVRDCDLLARYGGEEFVVLMPRTEVHMACSLAERLRAAVEARLPITISLGLAGSLDGDTSSAVISRADRALYAAKHAGRNRVFMHGSNTEELVSIRTTQPRLAADTRQLAQVDTVEAPALPKPLPVNLNEPPVLAAASAHSA